VTQLQKRVYVASASLRLAQVFCRLNKVRPADMVWIGRPEAAKGLKGVTVYVTRFQPADYYTMHELALRRDYCDVKLIEVEVDQEIDL